MFVACAHRYALGRLRQVRAQASGRTGSVKPQVQNRLSLNEAEKGFWSRVSGLTKFL
jgi:hypothetical protein